MSRIQLALDVDDLEVSLAFYRRLFGTEPAKVRPGYANFAIADPPLKLVLIENPGRGGGLNHLGIEVDDVAAVEAARRRLDEEHLPVTEEHPLNPVDVNGINLVAGEAYHLLYHDVYGVQAMSLRLTNTYGPHLLLKHDRQGFLTTFISNALRGEPIRVFGDGSQLRDFTYVSDVVDAFVRVAVTDEAHGRALNAGGNEPWSLMDVARLCQEIAGNDGGVETVPWPEERRKIDIGSIYVDHAQLTGLTGWEPTVGLREGLERTIAFYAEHGEHYWS